MNNNEFFPLRDFEKIAVEIGKAFNKFEGSSEKSENTDKFNLHTDIFEDEQKVYFMIELPGVSKEDVKLSISDDNILTINGTKERKLPDSVTTCCRQERYFGSFKRAFRLPEGLDTSKVTAKFNSGVLSVSIERKIEVKAKENVINID